MSNINKLIRELEKNGARLMSIDYTLDNKFTVFVHDINKAYTKKPVLEDVRDKLDYELLLKSWLERGKVILSSEKTFQKAISVALTRIGQ